MEGITKNLLAIMHHFFTMLEAPTRNLYGKVDIVVQSLSHVQLFVTPGTAAHQTSLSFTISQSLLRLMSIEPMMPSSHLILCRPRILPSSVFPSIRVFSNELALCIMWTKYWSFSISHSNEYSELTIALLHA